MSINFQYSDDNGRTLAAAFDRKPDHCPVCNRHMEASLVFAQYCRRVDHFFRGGSYEDVMAIAFQCPVSECKSVFVAFYSRYLDLDKLYRLKSRPPFYIEDVPISPQVSAISKMFTRIYREAYIADHNGLREVSGCGYRRALEFLVKDYLIHCGANVAEVEKRFLGRCIELIESPEVQQVAKRAAWLGNDETHYVREWKDLDLDNLKDLVDLTIKYIEMHEKLKKYKDSMPDGQKC